MPNKARSQDHRLRVCAVCRTPKYRVEFRQSNQNRREVNTVCWQCRHDDRRNEAKSFGVNFRRHDSLFRRKYHALNRMQRAKLSKKEVKRLSLTKAVEQQSVKLLRFPEQVARILNKTYLLRGDDPKVISDDIALMKIRDLLEEIDPMIFERIKNKRLSR